MNNIKEGGNIMALQVIPEWIVNLDDEDVSFIKRFLLASGSLKEMARQYEVTYPTVRLRLDKLIQKIKISDDTESEPYIALIKRLAINDKLDFDTAKILISEYKKVQRKEGVNYEECSCFSPHFFAFCCRNDYAANILIQKRK